MNIAITGLADNCLSGAPRDDSGGWDRRFHMGQDLWAAGATDVFEMHERSHWGQGERLEYLQRTEAAVWMQDWWSDVPKSEAYPIYTVEIAVGRRYFECTAAYMLGLAISLRPEAIGLWGISGEAECTEQRPNLEYLIGVAAGRGIEVRVHPASGLFTSQWESGVYGRQDPREAA